MRVANLAPGLYYEPVQPVRADGLLARSDVPLFIGFTRRGPVGRAVRVESWREFAALFGEPAAAGHLAPALRGFFETGGAAAYILRLAVGDDPTEGVAASAPANGWRVSAAFNWTLIDPRRIAGPNAASSPAWSSLVEEALRDGAHSPDPGSWGNRLSVAIARVAQPFIDAEPLPASAGRVARVYGLAGLETGGVIELVQNAGRAVTAIAAVDPQLLTVTLAQPLAALGLDAGRPFRFSSVDFRFDVLLDGRLVERFDPVSLVPGHSRAVTTALASSRYLAIEPPEGLDPANETHWLPEGLFALAGGKDRVRADPPGRMLDAYRAAFDGARRVEEAALVAAPDLVLLPPDLLAASPPTAPKLDCCDLEPAPSGLIERTVLDAETNEPLAGVTVEAAGTAVQAVTDVAGRFGLAPLAPGLFPVRLSKPGYEVREVMFQSAEGPTPGAEPVLLAPLAIPTRLDDALILQVQRDMAVAAGAYRVAIVDPPGPRMKPDELLTWRSRLGESDRIAFFAPWLVTPEGTTLPPSGHVCGAVAAGEAMSGIARAPANLPLRHVVGVALATDDGVQATLHAAGVNVIRAFPGRGVRIWGARTLSAAPEWRQLSARRVVDAIERTLEATLQWAVFEPNSLVTRQAVAFTIETLLARLWRAGGLAGASPEAAYRVKCDLDNNPDSSRAGGRLVAEIAVAPVTPFEFVVFRIAKSLDQLNVGE